MSSQGAIPSSNFFVIVLDDHGTWYQYHHLFHQLLQQQMNLVLADEAIAAMNLWASSWFEGAGFIDFITVPGGHPA